MTMKDGIKTIIPYNHTTLSTAPECATQSQSNQFHNSTVSSELQCLCTAHLTEFSAFVYFLLHFMYNSVQQVCQCWCCFSISRTRCTSTM